MSHSLVKRQQHRLFPIIITNVNQVWRLGSSAIKFPQALVRATRVRALGILFPFPRSGNGRIDELTIITNKLNGAQTNANFSRLQQHICAAFNKNIRFDYDKHKN